MNQIESDPDYASTFQRWYSVCLAAGRDPATARERAKCYAYSFVSRKLERKKFYAGRRPIGQ